MQKQDPNTFFQGSVMIVAPHMDDEALACGGLIASLKQKDKIFIIYATDGMKSPAPIFPGDSITPDLGKIRMQEAISAMSALGVPEKNLRFLGLPEARLGENDSVLLDLLMRSIKEINPENICIPFRYDRHPDHLAINHALTEAYVEGQYRARLYEYFIYHRWRLLPKGNIRLYINPEHMVEIDTLEVSDKKRMALDMYKSQTTLFYAWQTRPILTPLLLDEESYQPEFFLVFQPSFRGAAVFTSLVPWIRIAHRAEPMLQRMKYLSGTFLKRMRKKYARTD